jgi:hypothetical protein
MSMDASGKFGGTLVFGKWKGRPTVRQLVTPSNPQSTDQQAARNSVRVLGAGQHFAAMTAEKRSGETMTDKAELMTLAPSGQAWNGFLVKSGIGAGGLNYAAAESAYSALTSGEKTAYDGAAAALVPAIPAVSQIAAGGIASTPMVAGKVYFHYLWALHVAGAMPTAPGTTPPTYA